MIRSFALALCLAAPLAGGAVLDATSQAPSSARLGGRVTRSDTGQPIPGAIMQLQKGGDAVSSGAPLVVRSDAQGAFLFDRLPPGDYTLLATADRFFPPDATTTRPAGFGKRVELKAGQQFTNFDFVLVPAGGIEGRAVDEFGEPAPGVTIAMAQLIQAAGRSRLMPVGGRATAVTDDRGVFRVGGLAPGEYYVMALSGPFGTRGASAVIAPADTRAGFAPTYYPGTDNAADARPVKLETGRDTTGVVLPLVASKLVTVSGRVVEAGADTLAGGVVQLLQTQGGDVRALVPANALLAADGSFIYRNVPRGSYVLQARTRGGFGVVLVTVDDEDLTGVVCRVLPPATARGRIVFQGTTPPPPLDRIQIGIRPTDFVSGPVGGNAPARAQINEDLTFVLPGLLSTGVLVAQAPPAWQLSSATVGGRDIADQPFDFRTRDVSDLEIVLSDRWASVRASVTDAQGVPVREAVVLLYAEEPEKRAFPSRRVVIGRTTQDGLFTGGAVPGGAYLVVAVPPHIAPGPEVDPGVLESLRAAATRVSLVEGSVTPVALQIVR